MEEPKHLNLASLCWSRRNCRFLATSFAAFPPSLGGGTAWGRKRLSQRVVQVYLYGATAGCSDVLFCFKGLGHHLRSVLCVTYLQVWFVKPFAEQKPGENWKPVVKRTEASSWRTNLLLFVSVVFVCLELLLVFVFLIFVIFASNCVVGIHDFMYWTSRRY